MATSDDVLQKIIDLRGGTLAEFRGRTNSDSRVVMNRHLAVILLGRHWGDPHDERIVTKLDCSKAFVDQALGLAGNDTEFCAQLAELGFKNDAHQEAMAAQKPAEAGSEPKPLNRNSPIDLLLRIAKENYGHDRASLLKRSNSVEVSHIRRVLLCIGHEFLSLDKQRMGELFESHETTVSNIFNEVSYDYDYDDHFRKEVDDLCAKFQIPLNRRVKPKRPDEIAP